MESSFESDLGIMDEEVLKYIGITNLDFCTPLSKEALDEIKNMVFSINTLVQVIFRDKVRVKDIEDVKYILELSPLVDDSKVEKMILLDDTSNNKKILSFPFKNPDTWSLSYKANKGAYLITSIPNYRKMEEYISVVINSIDKGLSMIEKIKEVYDFIKLLDLDYKASDRLPDIINTRKTTSKGFNILFKEILSRLGIDSYIGKIKRETEDYITLVEIIDDKYNISGIYVFDPCSDSLPKALYKNEALRKINYNYFCLTLNEIISTKDGMDKLVGPLSLLNSDSLEFASRRINSEEEKELHDVFDRVFSEVYERVQSTKGILESTLFNIVLSTLHREDFIVLNRDVDELIMNNYLLRKKELFKSEETDESSVINVHDF